MVHIKDTDEPTNRPKERKNTIMVAAVSRCSGGRDLQLERGTVEVRIL